VCIICQLDYQKRGKPTEPEEKQFHLRADKQDVESGEKKRKEGVEVVYQRCSILQSMSNSSVITIVLATERKSKTGH
jgi:RNA binding exosome subunit